MDLLQLFKLINKYAQKVHQYDIGDAETNALRKTATWAKIKIFLQSKTVKITSNPPTRNILSQMDVDISFGINLTINPEKNAIAASFDKTDIYYTNGDLNEIDTLNQQITEKFGMLLARDMLKMYQTDPGCKNILKMDAQPNSKYYAKIRIKLN